MRKLEETKMKIKMQKIANNINAMSEEERAQFIQDLNEKIQLVEAKIIDAGFDVNDLKKIEYSNKMGDISKTISMFLCTLSSTIGMFGGANGLMNLETSTQTGILGLLGMALLVGAVPVGFILGMVAHYAIEAGYECSLIKNMVNEIKINNLEKELENYKIKIWVKNI